MVYAVSNIHGCYEEFKKLLDKISFNKDDIMYVLGDIVDYGDESMELLCDLSIRTNIYPVKGEHDAIAYEMLSGFDEMVKNGKTPDSDFIAKMQDWSKNGGDKTLAGFRTLDEDMKEGVLDYLSDMPAYEYAEVDGKRFVLVNAGIAGFEKGKELDDYDEENFYTETLDMDKEYFKSAYVVFGHTSTEKLGSEPYKIYKKGRNIAIDCGVAFGGRLGCLCLNNGKKYYI